MNPVLEIRFQKCNSASFERVVKECSLFDSFTIENDEYKLHIKSMSEVFMWHHSFFFILSEVIRWKDTCVYFSGVLIEKPLNNVYYNLYDITQCYIGYEQSGEKSEYCNLTGNGCRRIDNVSLDGISGFVFRRWYKFGAFVGPYTYKIDKDMLLETIHCEAEDKQLFACPVFSLDLIKVIVDLLPDVIDARNEMWEIQYETISTENGSITMPISIDVAGGYEIDDEVKEPLYKSEKPISEMSESEINDWLDCEAWKFS